MKGARYVVLAQKFHEAKKAPNTHILLLESYTNESDTLSVMYIPSDYDDDNGLNYHIHARKLYNMRIASLQSVDSMYKTGFLWGKDEKRDWKWDL